jgi:hypothetical protein
MRYGVRGTKYICLVSLTMLRQRVWVWNRMQGTRLKVQRETNEVRSAQLKSDSVTKFQFSEFQGILEEVRQTIILISVNKKHM